MSTSIAIQGTCDPRFASVRDAMAENFARYREVGASVAVTIDGRPVVDLWAGHADAARSRPWTRDTIVNVASTTKALTAVCAHRLVDAERLDLDAPVARYWPEFAQAGKDGLPVRFLLSHRAGLPAIDEPLPAAAAYDWDRMTRALAAQAPWWEPGTQHGYHAHTFGYLVGEVVLRITGMTLGTYFREQVAEPLGIDCHIGLAAVHDHRVAEFIPPPSPAPGEVNLWDEWMKTAPPMIDKANNNPPVTAADRNTRVWRAAELPAANGHTTARALARLYGALACGGTIDDIDVLSGAAIDRARTEQSNGPDAVLFGWPTRFGLGFMLPQPGLGYGPSPNAFGHPGAGGSIGFADPDARIGFGYTMNQMLESLPPDPRAVRLIDAVYAAL